VFRYVADNKSLFTQIDKTSQQSSFRSCKNNDLFFAYMKCAYSVTQRVLSVDIHIRSRNFEVGFPVFHVSIEIINTSIYERVSNRFLLQKWRRIGYVL
jgi:hypothetical protein